MLRERCKEIEELLLSEIISFYKERLVSVILFGSYGRGTQRYDSDIDVLIVARDLPEGRIQRIREFEVVEEGVESFLKALEEEGIRTYLSAIIKTPEEIEAGSPLLLDMVDDARILYDRGGFFKGRINRLKERLKKLGAKRVWKGNAWYWDLKPDYKPGEIFEL